MEFPEDLRPFLIEWLGEEMDRLTKFSSQAAMQYGKALDNLKKYPLPVSRTKQLLDVQYIGPKIVEKLNKRLSKYCEANGLQLPPDEVSESLDPGTEDTETTGKRKKRKVSEKMYIPQRRSGGFAIILALLLNDPRRYGMTKDEIVRHATTYCDQSFHSNPATNQFYSAWTSVKTLISKELIDSKGRPIQYFLTDKGEELALLLARNENLEVTTLPSQTSPTTPSKAIDSNGNNSASGQKKYDGLEQFEGHRYSIWESGTYSIELIIDNREVRSSSQRDYFTTKLSELGVTCSSLALSVGDGLWVARHREKNTLAVLDFIFERKRLDDLASSIKDGRYSEQKSRLKKTAISNIYYIVEETMGSDVSMLTEAIQTAVALNITNSQFFVKRTKDSDDTVSALHKLTNKIAQYYSKKKLIVIEKPQLKTQVDYGNVLNRFKQLYDNEIIESVYHFNTFQDILSKSDLTTVKELFIKMLMTINGVSLDKAVMIQKRYPTPKSLIAAYNKCGNAKDQETLMQNSFQDAVGNKKIGPVLSKKIYETWGKF